MESDSFCLEIGDDYLRIVDAVNTGTEIEIKSVASMERQNGFFTSQSEKTADELVKSIDELVKKLKINKKNVNIVIPDTYTYSQILWMPKLKEKELLSAIKYQADQFIPLPLEETTVDLDIIHEDRAKKTLLILIVAASQILIDRIGMVVEKAGLIPTNIENQASGFGRLTNFIYQRSPVKQTTIFVNLDFFSTTLYFYNPAVNLITSLYNFKTGFDLFSKEIQVNFNLESEKANEALRTIGMAADGSMKLGDVLQPALNEFSAEIEKFIVAVKEKEKIAGIDQISLFNLAGRFNLLEKEIGTRLGIAASQMDISSMIKKNGNFLFFKQAQSAFISVLAGTFK